MHLSAEPSSPLPAPVCRAMAYDLLRGLPDPVEDTRLDPSERQRAAIDEVALLVPADAGEMRIAIRCVSADAWANAYLRLMTMHAGDLGTLLRLTAQANAMGRAANANRALLQRVQAQRRRRRPDADPAAADAQAERRARDGLTQAWQEQAEHLAQPLPKPPAPAAPAGTARHQDTAFERLVAERRQQAEAAAAAGAPEPDWMTPAWRLKLGLPEPPPPTEAEKRQLKLLDEADRFAIIHPLRSRLIRRLGNLPPDCGIEPPRPELLEAIRSGNEANQRWADKLTLSQANQNAGRDREFLWKYEAELAKAAAPG